MSQHLAQLNIARMKFPLDDPRMAEFVAQIDAVNALADAAQGFVWRLQTADGDATGIDFFGADMLVNMSVWENLEALRDYAFRSDHRALLAARKRWFERMSSAWAVMWWVPAGTIPSLEEGARRLERLRADGPGPLAFSFSQPFPPG